MHVGITVKEIHRIGLVFSDDQKETADQGCSARLSQRPGSQIAAEVPFDVSKMAIEFLLSRLGTTLCVEREHEKRLARDPIDRGYVLGQGQPRCQFSLKMA